ncbi:MAG: GWxTD domain-containing protein [Candidatus Aminicenantes bacterium]|nr:GWxTD domain-containing protein [Candidatus Aminicenantes bacterium]
MKKTFFILFPVCFFLLVSCASYRLEKKLSPVNKEFLSKVRYIITRQERKIFLNLLPSDRKSFIEEFWEKRDPDPDTEINEFREEYFELIEEANLLFKEGSTPGWLQERGRVYITLGPPDNRETYPRGMSLYGKPMEIWYYGFFPVVFIDDNWTGSYKLEPLSAQHISAINKTQVDSRPEVSKQKVVFDFHLNIKKVKEGEALFQVEIPYKNIWFAVKENLLQTILEVSVEVLDQAEKKVWQHQENYVISLTEKNLEELIGKNYLIEVSANINPGNYILAVEIGNNTGGERVRKRAKFTV